MAPRALASVPIGSQQRLGIVRDLNLVGGVVDFRTLGDFGGHIGKRLLRLPPSRASRLLTFLLCMPGHAALKERIGDALWPAGRDPANNLRAAVHDLRVQLGSADFLVYDSNRYSLHSWRIDADEFELLVLEARRTRRERATADVLASYRAALLKYAGPFLPEEPYLSWAIDRRSQLQELFFEAAIFVAGEELMARQASNALELAQSVLRMDPAREDAARIEMNALIGLGRRAEAVRAYESLERFLSHELGCSPDPLTLALVSGLRISGAG